MVIMKHLILADLKNNITDHLLYKSGNKIVDDFIRLTQIKSDLMINMMEFVPYNQFKEIKFIAQVESYEATWINGNILGWDEKKMNFKRSGRRKVVLKRLNNSENITFEELNQVHISLITIYLNI